MAAPQMRQEIGAAGLRLERAESQTALGEALGWVVGLATLAHSEHKSAPGERWVTHNLDRSLNSSANPPMKYKSEA